MKKLFYFILLCSLLALASCNKSYDAKNEESACGTKTIKYSIIANAPGYDVSGTKSDLGAVARVYWQNDDKVSVYAASTCGLEYLGLLTAENTTSDGGRTTFIGTIQIPASQPDSLVFVHATGQDGSNLLTEGGKINFNMSQQSVTGMNVPFCAYATAEYSNASINQNSTDFKLATSYNVATLSNLGSIAEISKVQITHIASTVSFSWDGAVSVESGESNSKITITYSGANPKMIAFATPKSQEAASVTPRHIIINDDVASDFTNTSLNVNRFYAAGYFSFSKVFLFSVSATQRVIFSPGNLQAEIGADGNPTNWKFAAHQEDFIGNAPANTTITDGTFDLFGWSTDGGTTKPVNYKPWGINTSQLESNYPGNFIDWGTCDGVISTYGYGWSTLSLNQWNYLLGFSGGTQGTDYRNVTNRFAKANVNNVKGLLIFPDLYTGAIPETGIAEPNISSNVSFPSSSIPSDTWSSMEKAGCVFLPAAFFRQAKTVYSNEAAGNYWSSTTNTPTKADRFNFYSASLSVSEQPRYNGYSVRLVREL